MTFKKMLISLVWLSWSSDCHVALGEYVLKNDGPISCPAEGGFYWEMILIGGLMTRVYYLEIWCKTHGPGAP